MFSKKFKIFCGNFAVKVLFHERSEMADML